MLALKLGMSQPDKYLPALNIGGKTAEWATAADGHKIVCMYCKHAIARLTFADGWFCGNLLSARFKTKFLIPSTRLSGWKSCTRFMEPAKSLKLRQMRVICKGLNSRPILQMIGTRGGREREIAGNGSNEAYRH